MAPTYSVTLRFQFPAYDEKDGITFDVPASSKRDAIAAAKRQAERCGHWPWSGKGRATFKAIVEAA